MPSIAKRTILRRLETSGLLRKLAEDIQVLCGATIELVSGLPEAPPPPRFRGALVVPVAVGAVEIGRVMVMKAGGDRERDALRRWIRTAFESIGRQWLRETPGGEVGAVPGRVEMAARILRARHREAVSLGDVAAAVGLSRERLSRLFHESLGMTFSDYLNAVRLDACRERLRESDASITDIAFDSGFQSLSQFNRRFKAAEGVSPREYRHRLAGAGGEG